LLGMPLPLRPIQLLWLNLLTDGLPALALAMEKGDPDVMQRPPRPASEPVINRQMWVGIAIQTVVGTTAVLAAFAYGLNHFAGLPGEGTLIGAQTMAFIVLNCAELIVVYAFRSERFSAWSIGLFSNRAIVGATLLSFALLLAVVYIPVLDPIFYTTNLPLREWVVMVPLMLLPFVAAEVTKFYLRRQPAHS
jgi:Ca2+-transporting ATPase